MDIENITLYMVSEKADYNASGIYKNGYLTVLKGSKIRKANPKTKRSKIVSDIRNDRNYVDCNMTVKKNVIFTSPSTAAQFVADTSRNGLLYWRDKNNTKLRDLLNGGDKKNG